MNLMHVGQCHSDREYNKLSRKIYFEKIINNNEKNI